MHYRFFPVLVVLAFWIGYSSCKKIDTTDVGVDLIPTVDNITTFDTVLDVITNNELSYDSARVIREEDHALGLIQNDPDFGKTTAEIYFSLTPNGYRPHPFRKRDSIPIIDSVVLALAYIGTYGDTTSVEQFSVYEINKNADFSNNYTGYLTDTTGFPTDPLLLGSKLVDFRTLDDSVISIVKRDTIRSVKELRIPLEKSLGYRFLQYDTTDAYQSDSAFKAVFKGLALKVDGGASPAANGLAYFNLANNKTRLIFYYRVQSNNQITDTLATEFGFYGFNFASANIIQRTPANGYRDYLTNNRPADNKIFIQTSPGSLATVKIPGLRNLSNRIVHRAELVFEILNNIPEPLYPKPGLLFLDAVDTANKRILAIPYDFSYQDNFQQIVGGNAKNNKYTFNISRYVQSVITRKEPDYTLRLSAPHRTNAAENRGGLFITPTLPGSKSGFSINELIGAGRVVLTGGNYAEPAKRAHLRIVYSKI